jgi:hypothetical protein
MKSLIDFEAQQPFATRFFTRALENSQFVNAYILRSKDLAVAYQMALRLAQIVNCQQPPQPASACGQCQSCRWIEGNAHPGVITVSTLSYLPNVDAEGKSRTKTGRAQKNITVEQLNELIRELSLHSGGFHRIVILTGAQETPASDTQNADGFPPPQDWRGEDDNTRFKLLPLDKRIFPDATSNKFLKTLEEPPLSVTFFLLTDASDKLLPTIISRCQTVPFQTPPDFYRQDLSPDERERFGQLAQAFTTGDFLGQTRLFAQYVEESGLATPDALVRFQGFLWEQIGRCADDPVRFASLKKTLQHLEKARWMVRDKVKEEAVIEDLFLQLAQV